MQQHYGAYGIAQAPSPYGVTYQQQSPPRTGGTPPPPPALLHQQAAQTPPSPGRVRTGTTPLATGLSPQQPYHAAAVLPSPTAASGAAQYAGAARGGYAKAEPLGVQPLGVGVDPNAPSSPQYMAPGGGVGGGPVGTGAISPGNASTTSSAQSHAAAQGNGAVSVSPGVSASTSPTFSRVRAISRGACGETWLVQCATPGVPQGACIFGGVVPGSGSSPVPGAVYSRSPTTSTSTGGSSVCAVGTSFAMKVMKLKREGRSTEKLRQRSYQEVECLRKCQHPLVVGYIDHRENEQDMEFELVMELVEGGDLNLQIAVRAAASHYYLEAEALFYFVQACVSLRSLHRRNILHRDIKAGNFLCLRNGLLKLADFGFARDFSPQNVVGQRVCSEFMGTPSFMAPEVWKREGYGDRAEVWSLGIMLYQLLTLELPFQGSTLESLSRRVCRGTYKEIPETLRVSSHTRALLSSMLAVEPEKRPSLEEILQTPLMRRALRQFKHLCAQNNFLPPEQIAECD